VGVVGASSVCRSELLVAGLSRNCVVLSLFVVTQNKNMAWSSSPHFNIYSLIGNLYHRLAHQTVSSSCLHGRCSSINWACSQLLKLLIFLLLRGKFIIARMSFPELQYLNLHDIELNPTLPAPSKGEWRDFLSKCNSDVDELAARWDVDPAVLRAICEEGVKMDGMSNLQVETLCSPSLTGDEGPSQNEARLLMWIYCELEPWSHEKEFLLTSRSYLNDLSNCLSVKVWSPLVHLTAVKHCVTSIKHESLSLAWKKMESAVASGEFQNEA
jgi:hypothetical protein